MKLGEYLSIEELKDLLARKYVKVQRHPTLPLAILNYSDACTFDDYWPDAAQKCRGLIIGPVDGHEPCEDCKIVSRPFRKFFNLNHISQPDYQEANLPKVVPTVTEKMDGWLGILWRYRNADGQVDYGVASRGSFVSPGAGYATDKLGKLIKYGAILEFPEGYTAVFEIICKECRIVVDYPFEGLVLLALINNETGEEMPYDEMKAIWEKIAAYSKDGRPWIRLVKSHSMGDDPLSVAKLYENIMPDFPVKNEEGFVLTYPRQGTYPIKVKVKFEEYKRLHKLITGVTPQAIWRSFRDPMSRWEGEGIPRGFHDWANMWRDKLYMDFHRELHYSMNALRKLIRRNETFQDPNVDLRDPKIRKEAFEKLDEIDHERAQVAMSLLYDKIYDAYAAIWNKVRPEVNESETFYRDNQGE